MRMTPAQQHRATKLAAAASATDAMTVREHSSAYELMLRQLYEHRRTLKDIQSIERKITAKRAMLADYWPWIDGVLQADQPTEDLVLTSVFVWAIDAGEYVRALRMAEHILRHGLRLPDQYNRDAATALIDEFADAALKGRLASDQPEGAVIALQQLMRVQELTNGRDVPDQARAKLHKAIAYAIVNRTAASEADYKDLPLPLAQAALPHLHRAVELFSGVGVKKDIERLERRVKDAGTTPPL